MKDATDMPRRNTHRLLRLGAGIEDLETRRMLAADSLPAQSIGANVGPDLVQPPAVQRFDVDRDGVVSAADAQVVLSILNENKAGPEKNVAAADVNGDGIVSPLDALLVLNRTATFEDYAQPGHRTPEAERFNAELAEGEDDVQPIDLVALAQSLSDADAVLYGAPWDSATTAELRMFDDGAPLLDFQDVTNADRTPSELAIDRDITTYPTWLFADGSRLEGTQTIDSVASAAGVELPRSTAPALVAVEDTVSLLAGSPLHVALDGYDPAGDALSFEVSSDNDNIVPEVLRGRSLQFDITGYGTMLFHLFDSEVPRVTSRIAGLASEGFYDTLTFHRIIDNFVIQGGDPLGNGTGGSELPDFADQYDVDLQHNRTGVLSMAKSRDDTNNSQFFITEGPQRHLDFNHSIFGQLIEGEAVRQAISAAETNPSSQPIVPVVIENASVMDDHENGLLRLSAPPGYVGTATITILTTDADGQSTTSSFLVSTSSDTANGGPFLVETQELIEPLVMRAGTTLEFDLVAADPEGNAVVFGGSVLSGETDVMTVDSQTGRVMIEAPSDFVGEIELQFMVSPATESDTLDLFDIQWVTLQVLPATSTMRLSAQSDTGLTSADGITNAELLTLDVVDLQVGALLEIFVDGELATTRDVDASSITIDLGAFEEGEYVLTARQIVGGEPQEMFGETHITVDRTSPFINDANLPALIEVNEMLTAELTAEDLGAFTLELTAAPEGMVLDADTNRVVWTPAQSNLGDVVFVVTATDVAGNETERTFTMAVVAETEPPNVVDLIGLAKALADEGAILVGAEWDSVTAIQRQFFQEGKAFLPFVAGTNRDRTLNEFAISQDVEIIPTWLFADGTRLLGVQTIETLAAKLEATPAPYMAPSIVDLPARLGVLAGSPRHLPLNGYGGSDPALRYEVSADDADLVRVSVTSGNRAIRVNVIGYGEMIFELHDDLVPTLTQALVDRIESGFFDGLAWQRLNGHSMQTGDAQNSGLGTNDVGDLDDQFHPDLQHNQAGILSFAKLVDDANGSQFFVSHQPLRELDFHNSIVAQLVDGHDVRDALARATSGIGGNAVHPALIESVEVVENGDDALLRISASESARGQTNVNVAVIDANNNRREYVIPVDVIPDAINSGPYLLPEQFVQTIDGAVASLQLAAHDVEGDPMRYQARVLNGESVQLAIDAATGSLTAQVPSGYSGTIELLVSVSPATVAHQLDRYDRQRVVIDFGSEALPGDVDLNGVVDIQDVDLLCASLQLNDAQSSFDLNQDGQVSLDDYQLLTGTILGLVSGDANLDGQFDSGDLVAVFSAGQYEDLVDQNSTWQTGDWNCDGEFDSADLVIAVTG